MSPLLVICLLFQSSIPTHRISAEYENGEIRDVIQAVMRTAPQLKYTIASDVSGFATLKLTNVQFASALDYVCQASSLTYTAEGDTVAFRRVAGTPASMMAKPVTTNQGAAMKSTSLTQVLPIDRQIKELHAKSEPAYKVLRRALDSAGVNYVVSDALKNPISISVKNVPMREVLDAIMPLCNGQYTELTNIVVITQNQ